VVTATRHTFRNLDFGSSYTLEVIAMGSAENYRNSVASTTLAMTARRPLPTPQGIALAVTLNSLTVSWSAPPAEVEEYVISIMPGTEEARTVTVSDSTSTLFEGLSANQMYDVSVVSSGDATRYTASAAYTESITTEPLPQLTTPIPSVIATANSLVVEWNAVPNAEMYMVNLYNGSNTNAEQTKTVNTTSVTFDELEPGTAYRVEVIAQASGYRNNSAEIMSITRNTGLRLRLRVFLEGPLQ
ncbi:MAG: fibronectin type III domain-containing protein, partial [Candidatus Oxydemutatoraceae bacterium WSBS_2016_MAG_OTU14]